MPRLDSSHFIEWDPREYNSLADHAANMALDLDQDWSRHEMEAITGLNPDSCNFRLSVDGAKRGDGSSSGGLAITAFLKYGTEILICRAGCKFGMLRSAFEAELLALEWGIIFHDSYVSTHDT